MAKPGRTARAESRHSARKSITQRMRNSRRTRPWRTSLGTSRNAIAARPCAAAKAFQRSSQWAQKQGS